ncbi:MAG: glycosyltransferase [Candidatus Omnitrophica bacterium]|nr:glycosyltransferase [Candidatus Omnitrophota bacterium]
MILNLLAVLSLIATLIYIIIRLGLFLIGGYSLIDKVFSVMLMLGEFFVLLHSVGYVLNILRVLSGRKKDLSAGEIKEEELTNEPSVAILVAARHEPREVLEGTFRTITGLNYKNKAVYFLDDSSDDKYKKEAEELSRQYNLKLFRRKEQHGAKAGIINDCLKNLTEKYVVIFDADQNPLSDFLKKLIPLMEKDRKLAFIQTPQFYSNIEETRVARAAGFQQAVFYEYICEGKSTGGAMFCCGTNIIFRREALLDVGGLDESTVTEDFATSVKLHSRGWKSFYYNHVSCFGMAPENLTGYFKQQFRWAAGTIAVFKKLIWKFFTHPFSFRPVQWWEYLLSSSYYLIGLAFFFLMVSPVAYLLFKVPSFFVRPEVYFVVFFPYIILSLMVFYTLLGSRNYKIKDLFIGQLLGVCTFSVYIRAAVSAFLGVRTTFGITEKTKGKAIPYITMWPQISFIFLNFIAVVWGVNRFIYEREPALLVNGFWALYHFGVLSSIFYFNQEDALKISCKRLQRDVKFEYKVIGAVKAAEDLSKQTLKDCFSVFLPESLKPGTLIICKLILANEETAVFDGKVVWATEKKSRGGFETIIGLVTALEEDKEKLRKAVRK